MIETSKGSKTKSKLNSSKGAPSGIPSSEMITFFGRTSDLVNSTKRRLRHSGRL